MTSPAGPRRAGSPAAMTATVPSTGSRAREPGNGESAVSSSAAAATAAKPAQRSATGSAAEAVRPGARDSRIRIHSASEAPAPSSQIRVGVVKYAADWSAYVAYTDQASEAP